MSNTEYSRLKEIVERTFKGGEGSGNFGHAGRPGEVGGSAGESNVIDFDTWGRQHYGSYAWGLPVTDRESHREDYDKWKKKQEEINKSKGKPKDSNLSNDVKNYLNKNSADILSYNALGVRVLRPDQSNKIGDKVRPSYDWDFIKDESSDILLSGSSAINVHRLPGENKNDLIREVDRAFGKAKGYGEGSVVLIGGDRSSIGDDPDEGIITNPIILAILRP